MAYQIKRKKQIYEELELLNEDDSVYKTLTVNLTIDDILKEFRQTQLNLMHAQQEVKKAPESEEKVAKVGLAIVEFFKVIFGTNQTEIILEFYKENYTEMFKDIIPFIQNVVTPNINLAVKDYKDNIAKNYNRKQKRALKFKWN